VSVIPVPFHVGIVVADVERAMAELGDLLGVTWCHPITGVASHHLHQGEVVPTMGTSTCAPQGAVYSRNGPPHLELIQQREGTVWAETGLHHLGVWVDDFHETSADFEAKGCPLEAVASVAEDGTWIAGPYHRTDEGLRIEIVDIGRSGPKLARYLDGLPYA